MADWGNVQQGLVSGFEIGQKSGGKFAGLGSVLSKVADKLRNDRQKEEALNLLGQTEAIKAKYNPQEWKPRTEQEYLRVKEAELGLKPKVSPSLKVRQDKRTEDLLTTVENNKLYRTTLNDAMKAAENISSGIYGKLERGWQKNLDPENPALTDWQIIKMALLDEQLSNVIKTKGAISNYEMQGFQEAVANDDITSLARIRPVINRAIKRLAIEEDSKIKSYKKIYNEDPLDWEELQDMDINRNKDNNEYVDRVRPSKKEASVKKAQGYKGYDEETGEWVK